MQVTYALHLGDCRGVLKGIADCSIDAVVTDPPAGIAFMGKEWDHHKGGRDQWIAWLTEVMAECLRVLKPGGHAVVWALPRTSHWTATAIEDAGFEIRDVLAHLFGQGFPKSHNLTGEWQGWGTALKPAREDWILARKPLIGTVAANVTEWGTGALNIDAARIRTTDDLNGGAYAQSRMPRDDGWGMQRAGAGEYQQPSGRWPANLVLTHSASCEPVGTKRVRGERHSGKPGNGKDGQVYGKGIVFTGDTRCYADPDGTELVEAWECAPDCSVAELDRQSGKAGGHGTGHNGVSAETYTRDGKGFGSVTESRRPFDYQDAGHASRFFPIFRYCPKAPRSERAGSSHPTQKPLALMEWLCRLVTPPGGVILDPFAGSGTTGHAALRGGFSFVGVEQDETYHKEAEARLQAALTGQRPLPLGAD